MSTRRERLFAAVDKLGGQAFVCGKRPNQLYLLDHPDPSTVISRGNCHAVVFTPGQTVVFPGVWISNACRDMLENCEVVTNELGDPAPDEQLVARLKKEGYGKIVFDQMSGELAGMLAQEMPGTEVVVDDVVTVLRRTKDERDLAGMREAARVADLGMETAFAAIRPGVTCGKAIAEGTAAMLRAGAEQVSMAPASGVGTYYLDSGEDPRRAIQEGDMVFIDMGIYVHGYLGDMTRANIVGEGTAAQRELLETVQGACALATGMMAPGAPTAPIYQAVVDHYAAKGWEKYYVHHLSHGLGLGGDLPRIARGVEDVLQVGDALSCEPGLYIPGIGGARVENMIYIDEGGAESLTKCPLEPAMGL
ncbi:MAG: aminopeptidase P family protein [Gemmatimonadetes bacterium]|jgi:Xaa-Pro aminopeptidase|nr:aminopeptidase P family protein [Gemmatimonadota bacterium]